MEFPETLVPSSGVFSERVFVPGMALFTRARKGSSPSSLSLQACEASESEDTWKTGHRGSFSGWESSQDDEVGRGNNRPS